MDEKRCVLCGAELSINRRVCPGCMEKYEQSFPRETKRGLPFSLKDVFQFGLLVAGAVGGFWLSDILPEDQGFWKWWTGLIGTGCGLFLLFLAAFFLHGLSQRLSAKWQSRSVSGLANVLFSAPAILAVLLGVPVLILVILMLAGLAVLLWPLTIILLLLVIIARKK